MKNFINNPNTFKKVLNKAFRWGNIWKIWKELGSGDVGIY